MVDGTRELRAKKKDPERHERVNTMVIVDRYPP
jgi:hypothetical protein